MPTILRIILVVLCVVALYYLVVTLARSVTEPETGSLEPAGSHFAARGEVGDASAIGAHG
jgi:hypothetical protein